MSGDYRRLKQASHNFLRRMLRKPTWSFKRFVADRRGRQGRRWNFEILMKRVYWKATSAIGVAYELWSD